MYDWGNTRSKSKSARTSKYVSRLAGVRKGYEPLYFDKTSTTLASDQVIEMKMNKLNVEIIVLK